MKNEFKNMWRIVAFGVIAAAVLLLPQEVLADPFASAQEKVSDAWTEGKKIVYIIGGVGALALGVLAFFGRFKWATFFALVGGIFMIAIFAEILTYLGGEGGLLGN